MTGFAFSHTGNTARRAPRWAAPVKKSTPTGGRSRTQHEPLTTMSRLRGGCLHRISCDPNALRRPVSGFVLASTRREESDTGTGRSGSAGLVSGGRTTRRRRQGAPAAPIRAGFRGGNGTRKAAPARRSPTQRCERCSTRERLTECSVRRHPYFISLRFGEVCERSLCTSPALPSCHSSGNSPSNRERTSDVEKPSAAAIAENGRRPSVR
jgi:hypothetical protein